ncbi:MAG: hypothetical protein AABO58_05385 [Acidobacteriota bacterium]
MFTDPTIVALTDFVRGVGIPVLAASAVGPTRFPGMNIQNGCVLVDETRVIHPGNILHEAGHLAVTEPTLRNAPAVSPSNGQEMATLAWSYAATVHLKLDPALVFYPGSFQNMAESLIENFAQGRYLGLPLLQLFGMTVEPRNAEARQVAPFPHMLRWLR